MSDEARFREVIKQIEPPDEEARRAAQRLWDAKTKPRGSLGRLEDLGCRLAAISGGVPERINAAVVVAAADHGVSVDGVSAYPAEVTGQMLLNYARGGAAINVLARQAGARLVVVDAGVLTACDHPAVRPMRFGNGTASFSRGPAMERETAARALLAGIELARELSAAGVNLLVLGEMGIGNTTAAAALAAALLGVEPVAVCGPGTGLDAAGVARKAEVVTRALAMNRTLLGDPLGALAAVGGFEVALLAGVTLGGAMSRAPVLLDGAITGAAALVAARLAPRARDFMIAGHLSPEPMHALLLRELGLQPLLDLGLRLGEGSGAALALPLVQAAVALMNEMATFEGAGVTDAGR
jgi:nicotinate-nucleotide--dimethylbenzimidazole phosphoribosyltransferase